MNSQASSSPLPPAASCVQFRPEQLQLGTGIPLGSGAISQVVQCRLRCAAAPLLPVVVKIVSKIQVLQQGKVQSVMNEKATLQRLAPFPYVVRLYGTAQSEDELYFVLEWLPHGDLLQHIRYVAQERVRQYNEEEAAAGSTASMSSPGTVAGGTTGSAPDGPPVAEASASTGPSKRATAIPASSTALRCLDFHDIQLITAQLVLALEHTADRGVVLRDLKPENVAFDEKYRACLLDFDTADLGGAENMPETNGGVACPPPVDAAAVDEAESSNGGGGDAAAENGGASSSARRRRRLTVSQIHSMRRRTASFCGTAHYVSPEMVGECKWSFSSDLWALGALVYELVYGEHLFSGMTQFEVLQKVVHGTYVERQELFPRINFADDADGEAEQCCGGRRFAAVKDFIQRLLLTDPQKRLGVHPDTHRFDATALRRHALFDGFQWEPVEEQLRTFRMRRFDLGSSKATSTESGDASCDAREACSDASGASSAALKSLAAACVDPSSSLASRYHILPFNDPAYAEYVYRATADANPLEQFFTQEGTEPASTAAAALHEAAGSAGGSAPGAVPTPAVDSRPEVASVVDDDEVDDVIDDVGMHYTGRPADKCFQDCRDTP
ncbi:putative protein kinase [Leishmania major strain Friedlin]|uniref:non-specific serine/threonine protein kinase n=1 Tax=Leishmania major TaxID=5664 RepID=Q4Q7K3_LEIMA|nr:putative protein kinase [Leishmania major strain Friedlin]CAG9578296.1 protein_kinase_-_putativeGeneDB:LmjF.30.1000 [Leishmania major strain Friedlin]CAJ06102.1 putative protein kinase [Leishmania major strain Friedlin]|eukprot:XP_001684695.1 putative protein kinase [Leishmania major strain Friedlin]